ncbi:hypothetical protein QZH41_016315 [Actinostola sp. cb2023]|nr:hypothetical protein QZH41_016315 [Actinostola sp. cb2023]
MSCVEPFQFEPEYEEGEEPDQDLSEYEEDTLEDENSRIGTTDWCLCENCASIPTSDECYCCQEFDALNEKFDVSGVDCITDWEKFKIVCLEEHVLETALVSITNARCGTLPDPIENRSYRLSAYRQFTWWAHGPLGKKNRRIIPLCVVQAIRDKYPEESGEYTGFKEAEIILNDS